MKEFKQDLIEIRKNIFISKSDPDFLKKYVKYNPTDSEKLFEYAKELESNGETLKAYQFFSKAARYGHYQANKIIENTAKSVTVAPLAHAHVHQKRNTSNTPIAVLIAILLILLLLLTSIIFFYFITNWFGMTKINETNVYEKNITHATMINASPTKTEELVFISLHSAIENYQDVNGVYPMSLSELTVGAPNNYLSFIPNTVEYERTSSGFMLSVDGINGSVAAADGLLSLVFYEKTNELGLLKGGQELLALYPVAAGKEVAPPSESIVTSRVVSPNGGEGALGTRGLQLTDQFAIHGTNQPDLIGENVSMGCLRMKNEDIETLFPYIPLGTPFFVESESVPGKPIFANGLPSFPGLPEQHDFIKETTPDVVYNWRL